MSNYSRAPPPPAEALPLWPNLRGRKALLVEAKRTLSDEKRLKKGYLRYSAERGAGGAELSGQVFL